MCRQRAECHGSKEGPACLPPVGSCVAERRLLCLSVSTGASPRSHWPRWTLQPAESHLPGFRVALPFRGWSPRGVPCFGGSLRSHLRWFWATLVLVVTQEAAGTAAHSPDTVQSSGNGSASCRPQPPLQPLLSYATHFACCLPGLLSPALSCYHLWC